MSSLLKILLVSAPIAAILLYYVVIQQTSIDLQMQKMDTEFNREWNEFNADFSGGKNREKYRQRAEADDKRLSELNKQVAEAQKDTQNFKHLYEEAIKQFEAEKDAQQRKELEQLFKEDK